MGSEQAALSELGSRRPGGERQRLWPRAVKTYGNYAQYQRGARRRQIPVVKRFSSRS